MSDTISRRQLVKGGSLIAVGLAAPAWLSAIARADLIKTSRGEKPLGDKVFVVCQFSGGNDGLNMVVPYADSNYYKLRPTLAHPQDKVLKLNEQMGLHPAMAGMQTLFKEGKAAIVQNVGYPQPNRSHFESMRIWQSASPDRSLAGGWVGRYLDEQFKLGPLNPVFALGFSREQPLALQGEDVSVPCFASLQDASSLAGDAQTMELLREMQSASKDSGARQELVRKAADSALDAVQILSEKVSKYQPKQTYGNDSFGNGFKQIAQLIATSPATRVIYFEAGGFDTHANQLKTQEKLLGDFSAAMLAFQRELEGLGLADKVVTMTFSEFGRRAYENGSGTDHGKAAPMFVVGSKVKGGFYGSNPDLANLDAGDIGYKIDFRQMYATMIDEWSGGDSELVLAKKFDHVSVLG